MAVGQIMIDRSGDSVHVVDLSVDLGHRREGIGAAALRDVCASAPHVVVELWAGNTAGRALCAAAGFVVSTEDDEVVTLAHTR